MASVAVNQLSPQQKEQLAVCYASFILEGSGTKITSESLNSVLKASGVNVSGSLVNAVEKALKGKKATDFFGGIGCGGEATAETKAAPKKEENKKQNKKDGKKEKEAPPPPPPPPAEEEEDMDVGGLFD